MKEACYRIRRLRERLRFPQKEFAQAVSSKDHEICDRRIRRWETESVPQRTRALTSALSEFLLDPAGLAESRGFKCLKDSALMHFPPFDPFCRDLKRPEHPHFPSEVRGRDRPLLRLLQETFEPTTIEREDWERDLERSFACYSETPFETFDTRGGLSFKNRSHGLPVNLYLQSWEEANEKGCKFEPFYLDGELLKLREKQKEDGLTLLRDEVLFWFDRRNIQVDDDDLLNLVGRDLEVALRSICVGLNWQPSTRAFASKLKDMLDQALQGMPVDLARIAAAIQDGKSRELLEEACPTCGCSPWHTKLHYWRKLEDQQFESYLYRRFTDERSAKSA